MSGAGGERRYELRLPRKPEPQPEEELTDEEVLDLQKESKPVDGEKGQALPHEPRPPPRARVESPKAEVEIAITVRYRRRKSANPL